MEYYLEETAVNKLFTYQKDEFENQIIRKNKELKQADLGEGKATDNVLNMLKEMLDNNQYSNINSALIDYELAKEKHGDLLFYWFYKLGLSDGMSLKNIK